MHNRLRIPNTQYFITCLFFVKSKSENQLIGTLIELLQCKARPQTSSLQIYGLLTVLTLILWIWWVLQERVYRKFVKN